MFRPLQAPYLRSDSDRPHYQEYMPSKPLEAYVVCYWTVDSTLSISNSIHRVIPDGCVDIIFDLNTLPAPKGAFVAGLMSTYEVMELSPNCRSFGIRLPLSTASTFLRFPVAEFRGYHVSLAEIWGAQGVSWIEELCSLTLVSDIIAAVESQLMRILRLERTQMDRLTATSLDYIVANQRGLSIGSLADQLNYSERHIRRKLKDELGISPKELLSIFRFQRVLKEMAKAPNPRFADIAIQYGYYDQSHCIKEFKQLFGLTPSELFHRVSDCTPEASGD